MTKFVEQLRNQAKWYAHPGHNARDLMDSHLLRKAADEIERLAAKLEAAEKERDAARKCADMLALALNTSNYERDALRADKATLQHMTYSLKDRLEVAEKERDDVAQQLVQSERGKRAISDECDALRNEIAFVKEVEFPRKAQAVADAWEGKCKRLEVERDALRAKIEQMEQQEPVETTHAMPGASAFTMACFNTSDVPVGTKLYTLPGAQQCKNCNGMGDRFDPSGEKIPCDLCESNLEEIRVLVAEAVHDIISGGDFWLSISLAAKKIYAIPGAHPKPDCGEAGHDEGRCGNRQCLPGAQTQGEEK